MFVFVITMELLAVVLLSVEAGLLIKEKSFHWIGYVGAACAVAGGMIWAKFIGI